MYTNFCDEYFQFYQIFVTKVGEKQEYLSAYFSMVKIFKTIKVNIGCRTRSDRSSVAR